MEGLYLLLLLSVFVVYSNAFFDVEEINKLTYAIEILDKPVLLSDKPTTLRPVIHMTNKFGQEYECLLPVPSPEETLDAEKRNSETEEKAAAAAAASEKEKEQVNITMLLEPMKNGPCLFRTKDWWTYEFCYGRYVKQYHIEDGKPVGLIVFLGYYDHDYDWTRDEEESSRKLLKHHSQFYTNGTKCDITGNLRKTEVRFVCDPTLLVDSISRVDEPQSCEYLLTITTSKICSLPQLQPTPTEKPKQISCSPVLTKEQYEKYQSYQTLREKLEEKKVESKKIERKEQMLKVLEGEDLSQVDVDSEEGMAELEVMVGDKMADKLVKELGLLLDSKKVSDSPVTSKIITDKDLFDDVETEKKSSDDKEDSVDEEDEVEDEEEDEEEEAENEKQQKLDGSDEIKKSKDGQGLTDLTEREKDLIERSDVRSDAEFVDNLVNIVKRMTKSKKTFINDMKNQIREELSGEVDEIIDDTETEMNVKLNSKERSEAVGKLSETLDYLMEKLDDAESEITKVTEKISEVQNMLSSQEELLDSAKKDLKHDNKRSVKKDLSQEEEDKDGWDKLKIHITNVSPQKVGGLKDSPSEERVVKRLEQAIKEKLTKAKIDTGGRDIEVKLITTSFSNLVDPGSVKDFSNSDEKMDTEEAQQFQHMIYNLMIGNQAAYEDIENQRKSEKSYKFTWDDSLVNEAEKRLADISSKFQSPVEQKEIELDEKEMNKNEEVEEEEEEEKEANPSII